MLREYAQDSSGEHVWVVLKRFKLGPTIDTSKFNVLDFEILSPDSFVWKIELNSSIYYLYAEDYVPSIDHIKAELNNYVGSSAWEFVSPHTETVFELSAPVQSAKVYQRPERVNDLMQYAVDSGYDFVFLAKSLSTI